ncbi:hypothetical protein HDU98_009830 [Podochytrium sp. JEL0797]|nr:hypothetical protein HDU98_009830 [Podochytrium sp. JEL0797]
MEPPLLPAIAIDPTTLTCRVTDATSSHHLWTHGCYGRASTDDARTMRRLVTDPISTTPLDPPHTRTLSLLESIHLHLIHAAVLSLPLRRLLVTAALLAAPPLRVLLARLTAYRMLRTLGWVVRDGIKFGADWVVYKPGGPVAYHADYAVVFESESEMHRVSWRRVLASVRFMEQAKKKLVYVSVVPVEAEEGGRKAWVDALGAGQGGSENVGSGEERDKDDERVGDLLERECERNRVRVLLVTRWIP